MTDHREDDILLPGFFMDAGGAEMNGKRRIARRIVRGRLLPRRKQKKARFPVKREPCCGYRYFFSSSSTAFRTSAMSAVGSKRAMTSPCRLTRNLVKFQRM